MRPMYRGEAILASAILCLVLLALVLAAQAPAAAAENDASSRVSGTVTVDGDPAEAGVELIGEIVTDESETVRCGTAQVSDGGAFDMPIAAECEPGAAMRIRHVALDLEARDQVEVPDGSNEGVLVRFETPPAADGLAGAALVEAEAEAEATKPLIGESSLIVLLTVIALAAVGLLAYVAHHWTKRASDSSGTEVIPQMLIEGLVLSLAIVAIVVLGVSAKLTSEGLVSVLAGIVGYAAGRGAAAADRRA